MELGERERSIADADRGSYLEYWSDVGAQFPDLAGAYSTRVYRQAECALLERQLTPLAGLRLLKTDLWDEAKNTRILAWAAEQGASPVGIDISPPTLWQARQAFPGGELLAAVADVRHIPLRTASVDAVYSMGTIEHFLDPEQALAEIQRVLRPGGRAVIGVPNLHDPFLRPLLVRLLRALGLYSYGYERAFSRRQLDAMLVRAGFEVVAHEGILFMPGWLRMADLALHTWCRPLSVLTGLALRPFAWLERRYAWARRNGYLIASVGVKPGS